MGRGIMWLAALYAIGYWLLLTLPHFKIDPMWTLNEHTVELMDQLVQTKYFRIIRLNLNQECPIDTFNKICKSKSCTICRCNEDDIP